MKKLIISVLTALLLIALFAVPAVAQIALFAVPALAAQTENITATVSVGQYSSVTITDNGTAGLDFGSLDPGTVKSEEAALPSVTVTAAGENNVDVTISISGDNFTSGSYEFGIGNAYWNTSNDSGTATAMDTTPTTVATLSADESVDIYHWLSIPAAQESGSYSTDFTYSSSP